MNQYGLPKLLHCRSINSHIKQSDVSGDSHTENREELLQHSSKVKMYFLIFLFNLRINLSTQRLMPFFLLLYVPLSIKHGFTTRKRGKRPDKHSVSKSPPLSEPRGHCSLISHCLCKETAHCLWSHNSALCWGLCLERSVWWGCWESWYSDTLWLLQQY